MDQLLSVSETRIHDGDWAATTMPREVSIVLQDLPRSGYLLFLAILPYLGF